MQNMLDPFLCFFTQEEQGELSALDVKTYPERISTDQGLGNWIPQIFLLQALKPSISFDIYLYLRIEMTDLEC